MNINTGNRLLTSLVLAVSLGCAAVNASAGNDDFLDDVEALPASKVFTNGEMPKFPVLGKRRVVVVVGQWSNSSNVDPAVIRQQLFSDDPRSLRSFVLASSDNKLSLEEFKLLTPSFGEKPSGNCSNGDIYPRAERAIEAAGLNQHEYDQLIVAVACQGGANAGMPGNRMILFGQGGSSHVFLHEYGHNLGVDHPRTYANCRRSGDTVYAPEGCAVSSIADSGDPVGGGTGLYPAVNRAFAGWLDERQSSEITKTGIYKLSALGEPGPQAYAIRRPGKNEYIMLEHRQANPPYDFPAEDNRSIGVWVRYSTVGSNVSSILLNANPEDTTFAKPTLLPSRKLIDEAAGVKLHVCITSGKGRFFAVSVNNERLPDCTATPAVPLVTSPEQGQDVLIAPVFAGSGIPGASIEIGISDKTASTIVDAQGHWRFVDNEIRPEGEYSFRVRQALGPLLVSEYSAVRKYRVKHSELDRVLITAPLPGAKVGRYPLVTGRAVPGAEVSVAKSIEARTLAQTEADERGNWSVKITEPLPDGSYSISARQKRGGQTSAWGNNVQFNVSSTLETPVIQIPEANREVGVDNVILSGTTSPGAIVVIVPQGRPSDFLATTTANAVGVWEVKITGLSLGTHTVSARSFDNGSHSGWSLNRRFTVVQKTVQGVGLKNGTQAAK
ncbi:hypothetical protein LOY24_01520 [Pseudomonas putida]|jgi:hypothetical protein|uniref:hypothetical protein n=1 Tax=Pseudomonas putida TaxID=303 RepID=UPI00215E8534|nr:hypothetical protein [Pseudomonas putida]UVL78848.1 hypothetical protein LOY24_01520 [Pseudomonas putida]